MEDGKTKKERKKREPTSDRTAKEAPSCPCQKIGLSASFTLRFQQINAGNDIDRYWRMSAQFVTEWRHARHSAASSVESTVRGNFISPFKLVDVGPHERFRHVRSRSLREYPKNKERDPSHWTSVSFSVYVLRKHDGQTIARRFTIVRN